MSEDLSERLDAVERSLTDGETTVESLSDAADAEKRLDALEARAADLDDRVTELEAATQALRGYVGGVRAVNRDVERRADAALAGVESLAETLDESPDDSAFEAVCAASDGDVAHVTEDGDESDVDDDRDGDGDDRDCDSDDSNLVTRLRDVL
jgi:uncharacterized coiled-coil protein SlyX